MIRSDEKLKTVFAQSKLRDSLDILWLLFVHLLLFLVFMFLWPVAWLGLYVPLLFVSKSPWSKSFDHWAKRVLTTPRDALLPQKENHQLN
jgi:hypothetical protein